MYKSTVDTFRKRLLNIFDRTYEGLLEHYLVCEIAHDLVAGTTQLSQTHYAEEVLRTFGFWKNLPSVTPMKPNTRLSKDDCDPSPKPDFHKRDRGIVGSLAYLVTMTRPDLARSYSELGKYVQFPGNHTWRHLKMSYVTCGQLGTKPSLTPSQVSNRDPFPLPFFPFSCCVGKNPEMY